MKKRWRPWRATFTAVLFVSAIIMLLRWFEHSRIYFPNRHMEATGAELGRPFEDVTFKTADGLDLNGWFFPASANSPRRHLAVLVCHGNNSNISRLLDFYTVLLETGVSVFAFDYRGYGRSQGRPGEEGTYRDAQAAHRWLRQKGFPGNHIIAYGESLGGGIVSELALREPLAGLILQSTFTRIVDIGAELYPWLPVRWINTIQYDTHGKLPRLRIPVLILHSRQDELIGFHHAERNFAAANEPKLFGEIGGDHNNPLEDRKRFLDAVGKFLKRVEH